MAQFREVGERSIEIWIRGKKVGEIGRTGRRPGRFQASEAILECAISPEDMTQIAAKCGEVKGKIAMDRTIKKR